MPEIDDGVGDQLPKRHGASGSRGGWHYDSREPLLCCEFKDLDRRIGVLVGSEFKHMGKKLKRGESPPLMREVEYETISVNTATFGWPELSGDVPRVIRELTLKVVRDLEAVIAELTGHRDRLLEGVKDAADL